MKNIIDSLYKVQSEDGELSRAVEQGFDAEFETLQKEVVDVLGRDIWIQYDALRTKHELDELEHHYKQGLKDGAKLILELLK